MEEKVGQEIDIESSIDPITNLEKDDRRIIFHTNKSIGWVRKHLTIQYDGG